MPNLFNRLIIPLLIFSTFFSSCSTKPPLIIGFSAELTGRNGELGVGLRNGVQMAVDEINAAGGIDGQKIQLLVEDDFGTPQGAKAADTKLIDAGAIAIIGHLTSDQTIEGYEVTEARGVVLLSATASTSLLTEKKDHFFRTVASTDTMGNGFASYIFSKKRITQIAIICDQDNATYSEPLVRAFKETYTGLGGSVAIEVKYSAASSPDFSFLIENLRETGVNSVLIVASPYDTAMIAQTISLGNWSPSLFTSSWALGEVLIQNGGNTVENMETVIAYDTNDPSPELAQFKSTYEMNFNAPSIFTSMEGYETMHLLAEALLNTHGSADGLPEALIEVQNFEGLTGLISLDSYGDVVRPLFIQKVIDGKFETIEKLDLMR